MTPPAKSTTEILFDTLTFLLQPAPLLVQLSPPPVAPAAQGLVTGAQAAAEIAGLLGAGKGASRATVHAAFHAGSVAAAISGFAPVATAAAAPSVLSYLADRLGEGLMQMFGPAPTWLIEIADRIGL